MLEEYEATLKPEIARVSLDFELQQARACISRARQGLDGDMNGPPLASPPGFAGRGPKLAPPELRMIRLELLHAIGAIERAWLLARDGELEADLARLLEAR